MYLKLEASDDRRRESPSFWRLLVCIAAGACLACMAVLGEGLRGPPGSRGGLRPAAARAPAEGVLAASAGPRVQLGFGQWVAGAAHAQKGFAFHNIPYGSAGRWEEPRPATWRGDWDATESRTSCMQSAGESATEPVEDCLKLDVFTPWAAPGLALPVFVWFYGGAFMAGSAADISAEAAWHLVASHGMVVVVPDTRVGAFGYLGSYRLQRNSTGNWGTLDQKLALRWVSEHIARFGGDPHRITIGGWSSGAAASSVLLTMEGELTPVRGAIMMSGGFTDWAAFTMKAAEANYDALLKAVGCEAGAGCRSPGPPCRCLLDVPAERLVEAGSGLGWAPIVDGVVMSVHPMEAVRAGKVRAVPIVIGSCLEDGLPALGSGAAAQDFERWMEGAVPRASLGRGLELYMGPATEPVIDAVHAGYSPAYWAMRRAAGDRGMACVARRVARAWPRPAWQYIWEDRFPGEDTAGFGPGFAHESDQRFLFQTRMPKAWLPTARAVRGAFAAFIHGGEPSLDPHWPRGQGRGAIFGLGGPRAGEIRADQCDFWDRLAP